MAIPVEAVAGLATRRGSRDASPAQLAAAPGVRVPRVVGAVLVRDDEDAAPVARPVRPQAVPPARVRQAEPGTRIALDAKRVVANGRSGLVRPSSVRPRLARPPTRLRVRTSAAVSSVHVAPAIAGFVADLHHRWPSAMPSLLVVAAAGVLGAVIANTPLR